MKFSGFIKVSLLVLSAFALGLSGCVNTHDFEETVTVPPDAGTMYEGGLYSGTTRTRSYEGTNVFLASAENVKLDLITATVPQEITINGITFPAGTQLDIRSHHLDDPDGSELGRHWLTSWAGVELGGQRAEVDKAKEVTARRVNDNATQTDLAKQALTYNPETTAVSRPRWVRPR